MQRLVSYAAVLTIGIVAACGGNVVVDGTTIGNGGSGGSTATVAPPGAGGSGSCFSLPSQATLTACGTTSGGAGSSCVLDFCDAQATVWAANCTGAACSCIHDGTVLCSCALDVAGDICAGASNCCFAPH
jgi:hypothetical protein